MRAGLIGIVKEEAQKDFWGTMKRVAEIGYRGIEAPEAMLNGSVAENLRRFHGLGLQVLTVSAKREQLRDDIGAVIAKARSLQSPRVSCWWGPAETKEGLLKDAEIYNAAGARLAAEGIKLCYHNHAHEFTSCFNGVQAFDVLVEHTNPKSVFFEVDIMWVTFGGEDPVRLLKRMAGRVPAIHIKDVQGVGTEKAQFTALGTGIVEIREAVEMAIKTGVEWGVVEQDQLRNLSAFETITLSYLHLKEMGLVE